jgi:hypothetical protein
MAKKVNERPQKTAIFSQFGIALKALILLRKPSDSGILFF